jgi:hypothetical protein
LNEIGRRALENSGDFLERVAANAKPVVAALDVAPPLLGAYARKLSGLRLSQPVLFTKRPYK